MAAGHLAPSRNHVEPCRERRSGSDYLMKGPTGSKTTPPGGKTSNDQDQRIGTRKDHRDAQGHRRLLHLPRRRRRGPAGLAFPVLQRRDGRGGRRPVEQRRHHALRPKHLRGVRWLLAAAGQRRPVCRRHQQHPEGMLVTTTLKSATGGRPRSSTTTSSSRSRHSGIDPARTSRSPAARHLSAPCFASAWSMSFACSSTRSSGAREAPLRDGGPADPTEAHRVEDVPDRRPGDDLRTGRPDASRS